MEVIIGRLEEKKILDRRLATNKPELIAVFGRRRVGKTYLIRHHLKNHIVFELTGIHDATLADQMMAAQASRAERLALADDIVVNDGDLAHLQRAADQLHARYVALASSTP